ncbi:hypothetical protein [Erythrobacter sp. SG61-1L]|nr:hypothetical protein [Erythrobacter sp. SG61-1L]
MRIVLGAGPISFLSGDFALKDFADERGPSLASHQLVNALAKTFRQADVG